MELYKYEREMIDRRLKDILKEIEMKSNKADVNEMRLYFDSQLTTEREQNSSKFTLISSDLK